MNIEGAHYDADFISADDRATLAVWLQTIRPIWEERHSRRVVLRPGQSERRLLRPVYWLGGWQFACLNYYHPPHVIDKVVAAEPFPPVLRRLVDHMEVIARDTYSALPDGWCLNTCLINFYGMALRGERWLDTARVGGHHDYEPGPVGSLSLGAPARFQFATRHRGPEDRDVVAEEWLTDRSMLLFGTPRLKNELYHRVPRVSRKGDWSFPVHLDDFQVRRVNFTLRYIPVEHIQPLHTLGAEARGDVEGYLTELAAHSPFWRDAVDS